MADARNVRPRVTALLSPRDAFLERWRTSVQTQVVVVGTMFSFFPNAENARSMVNDILMNMVYEADIGDIEVFATITMSIPELAVDSRPTLELRYSSIQTRWYTRPIRDTGRVQPPMQWAVLGEAEYSSAHELLITLRFKADEMLLDVWTRRQLATKELAHTLPADVLQFELGPFISYARQQRHKRRSVHIVTFVPT